jgi:solute carrier family 25 phosphate transporter 23/24/25/41
MPVYGLKFGLNDHIKDAFRSSPGASLDHLQKVAAGTLAGTATVCCTYPLDLVRTRLSLAKGLGFKFAGIFDCAVQTLKHEGIRGLYKGLGMTLLSGSPYVGLQMAGYDFFKGVLPRRSDGTTSVGWKVVCGALAGVVAQTITFPGDTVRRRLQTNGVSGKERVYAGTMDCMAKIWRREGFAGFYAGYTANLVRSIPGAGIQFVAYDVFKSMLGLKIH